MREMPDFSDPRWVLNEVDLMFANPNGKIKIKNFLADELVGQKLSDYTCQPLWFGMSSLHYDKKTVQYVKNYKDFNFQPDVEDLVCSENIAIFGFPVLRTLQFTNSNNLKLKRVFIWFIDKDDKWHLADVGDSVQCVIDYKNDRLISAGLVVFDLYKKIKHHLGISNPRL